MRRFMFRAFICALTVSLVVTTAVAQSGDWSKVQSLPPGKDVWIETKQGQKLQGQLDATDSTRIVIWSQERSFPGRVVVKREIARDDVKRLRLNHRLASVAVGTAIGVGVGVGLGAAIDARSRSNEDRGLAPAAFGILGGGLGAILGKVHPFIKGKTIYEAP